MEITSHTVPSLTVKAACTSPRQPRLSSMCSLVIAGSELDLLLGECGNRCLAELCNCLLLTMVLCVMAAAVALAPTQSVVFKFMEPVRETGGRVGEPWRADLRSSRFVLMVGADSLGFMGPRCHFLTERWRSSVCFSLQSWFGPEVDEFLPHVRRHNPKRQMQLR